MIVEPARREPAKNQERSECHHIHNVRGLAKAFEHLAALANGLAAPLTHSRKVLASIGRSLGST